MKEEKTENQNAEMVSISKSDLDAIKLKLGMLESVADKGRIASWMAKRGEKITPVVKVSKYNNKLVVAWRMVVDDVYKDSEGVWHEKQIVEITLEDDKKVQLNYLDFQRNIVKCPAEIIERTNKPDKDPITGTTYAVETFKVKIIDTGEVVTLDGKFIN